SPFGRHGYQPAIDVVEAGLSQSRAGRDDRGVARLLGRAALKHDDLVAVEDADAVRHRFEIVQEADPFRPEVTPDLRGPEAPRDVGELRALIDHGPGHPDRCRVDGEASARVTRERVED